MAHGPTYRVKFRRRREGKTDYYRRRRLLLSRLPRLVVRKTNTKVIVQVVTAHVVGDMTVASAVSTELANYGWEAGTANLPAAYLTGLLAGLRAKAKGITTAVLDIGLNPPIRGSKVYAALKGALDAELEIPHDPEILPSEERITGQHIVEAFKYFGENPGHGHQFSKLGKKKTALTSLPKKFETVKKAILAIPKTELKKPKKKAPATKKATPKKKARPKKEKAVEKAPRAVPRKPKPKKLISRSKKGGKRKK
ncbi:MAG: 50S ribosomal protein L18 [Candidatus Thorarchaeota archaeon]|nr:MAG: 50S ribosomal protein L18 [Candidatus Thorarchaeota archaeon]RLI56006.1 MAG: 50S ribosomal protein L18 [Candidatus Thorarchaeota archaeon]HDM59358.1 50S ribosomal protein L18 [Bacillota bacterium]